MNRNETREESGIAQVCEKEAGELLDNLRNVIQSDSMQTNVRNFLRDFAAIKARAQKGETIHVIDREGEFLFSSATRKRSLLGASKAKLLVHGDITGPTLSTEAWKPSL